MTTLLNIMSLPCICIGLFLCSKNPYTPQEYAARDLTVSETVIAQSGENFGLKLFQEINRVEQNKNLFISPLSVSMALGMTVNGADGSTREAMVSTLELTGLSEQDMNSAYKSLTALLTNVDSKVQMDIANSIWYRNTMSFEEPFLNLSKTYFDAEVSGLNFSDPGAKDIINDWVDRNTNGRIKEIVEQIDPLVVMYLINAIYFKGTWTYEFDEDKTQDDDFTLSDGTQKNVRMMEQENTYHYYQHTDFQAVDLPYGDGKFSMAVLLPAQEKSVDDLIEALNQTSWSQWMNSFTERTLTLKLPKFSLEYKFNLNDVLKAQGMEIAFDPARADFTRMQKTGGLYISNVEHKTFVEVNEEGTEAAAVTSVEISRTSTGGGAPVLMIDRPFLFVIRERSSDTILFIGKIIEPML